MGVWIIKTGIDNAELFIDEPSYASASMGCYEWKGESIMEVWILILSKALQRKLNSHKQPFQVNLKMSLLK